MRLPSFNATTSNNPRQWLVSVLQVVVGAGLVAGVLILTLNADSNAGRQAAGRIAGNSSGKLTVPVSISTMPRPVRELSSPLLTPHERPKISIQQAPEIGSVTPMEPMTLPDSYQPIHSENYFPTSTSTNTASAAETGKSRATAKEARQKAGQDAQDTKDTQEVSADDPAYQRYLEWVRSVEDERANLRRQGPDLERRLQAEATPTSEETSPAAAPPTQRRASEAATSAEDTLRSTEARLSRAKPPVPVDCASFDRYYTQAMDTERRAVSDLIQAAATRDTARLNSLRRDSTAPVDTLLRSANDELDRTHRARGATTPTPRMQTGDGASLLGELTRPGALK